MVLDTGHEGKILTSAGDNAFRWRHGERLEDLFEDHCDALRRAGRGGDLAVDGPAGRLTYDELDAAANRVARFLVRGLRIQPGDRVGLLFDDAVDGYICMLAVLKVHAVYVPMDPGFPADRISYIAADAGVRTVLSHSRLAGLVAKPGPEVVYVDQAAMIAAEKSERLTVVDTGAPLDDLCYVIYTSGTTGRPKGVAVSHRSICNFVRVAAETYGYTAADRVYQGLTMAFDFAVEETWVPWLAGAALVPKPRGGSLLGPDLAGFLREQRISALCCVPTLLATLDEELPQLRFLLVSGEACPPELADRWHHPGRRFLNVYGPTEATVSATWTLLEPGRPVTIGVPLPTYSVAIIDRQSNRVLPADQTGEIAIAGIGLAEGYLNLPDKTREAFTPDFAGMPGNPSRRIYRTGDLGKITADGQIVHKGRIDTQVKIRGYRIELTEIESVLAEASGVAQAARHHVRVRAGGSAKVDRKSLPPPSGQRHQVTRGAYRAPAAGTESVLAGTLTAMLGLDRISAEADFFDELGASSLLMARFIAAAGKASSDISIGYPPFMGTFVATGSNPNPVDQPWQERSQATAPSSPALSCYTSNTGLTPPSTIAPASSGVLVRGVICGSPAARAGMTAGAVITAVSGQPVRSPDDLMRVMARFRPGDTIFVSWTNPAGKQATSRIRLTEGPPQ